jgi:hypothetical protein
VASCHPHCMRVGEVARVPLVFATVFMMSPSDWCMHVQLSTDLAACCRIVTFCVQIDLCAATVNIFYEKKSVIILYL